MFVGRDTQLDQLDSLLERARRPSDDKPGKAALIRGRRRVGKSRLVEEFVKRARVPHLFFTASGLSVRDELALFVQEVLDSDIPGADAFADIAPNTWDAALRLLASLLPDTGSVIVIDELPYLTAADPGFEGTLQKVFDRYLARKPVLLIGIGSDLAMMEALNKYGRPFHQRATEMVIPPLSAAEVAALIGLDAADAYDAFLVTGGLPLICDEWPPGVTMWEYLEAALSNPTSALLVSAERALAAEFPTGAQARTVLGTIGSGECQFSKIGSRAGDLRDTSLARSLKLLTDKRIVAVDHPLSTATSKETRYRVADPYLRFWLTFLGPQMAAIERGRGDLVLARIRTSWTSWRGRAIEPVLRDALDRLIGPTWAEQVGETAVVGGYWTRTNNPEIDLVVADKSPIAKSILAVGSIKWHENQPFDNRELAELIVHRSQLPGANDQTPLIVVSRAGCAVSGVQSYGPEDLITA